MEPQPEDLPRTQRHKCSACYKQYKRKEHLIEHMRLSYHSIHDPKCNVCQKHCKSLESVREHLTGPLPKGSCSEIFASRGCKLCLNIFDSSDDLGHHMDLCQMVLATSPVPISNLNFDDYSSDVVAMDCEMVGGGSDGSLDLCARVCIIDEGENVIFHSFVKPIIPVSDYRYELTGITEDQLENAIPLSEIRQKIEEILYNGESLWKARLEGGKARILVGHDLEHDLDCLRMNYPEHLIRDTAKYCPLMKTNLVSHSLKYLTKTYLGCEIQTKTHDPYEDCIAALRLYKRMRDQSHHARSLAVSSDCYKLFDFTKGKPFDHIRPKELEKLSCDDLLALSISRYKCWCLDNTNS